VKYNPAIHHRRSIRLWGYDYATPGAYFITICAHQQHCWFGEVVDGVMVLNSIGNLVQVCWQRLTYHFSELDLDTFVVMPNHIHGIIGLAAQSVGAKHSVETFPVVAKMVCRMLRPYGNPMMGRLCPMTHNRVLWRRLCKISNLSQPGKSTKSIKLPEHL
jgi:REP element-mobilizing transposase RayT